MGVFFSLTFILKECFPYWDQEKKAFEDIEVEVTETEVTAAFTTRTLQIYHTKVPGALGGSLMSTLQIYHTKVPLDLKVGATAQLKEPQDEK